MKKLTARELQVAELMMQGLSYTEIAKELEIAPNTVKKYRKSLYSKLKINSRRELFAYYTTSILSNLSRSET